MLVTLFLALLSFAINIYWVNSNPEADFFSPISRLWELMLGGILAYIFLHRPQYIFRNATLLSMLSLFGLLLVGLSIGFLNETILFPGWWAIFPTLGTFLVIAGGADAWVNRYLLSNRIMVLLGLISYPLYLWHWPLLSFARIIEAGKPSSSVRNIMVIASILLAWGTYLLVEKRFKREYSKIAISFLSLSMTFIFLLGLLVWRGGLPPRHNSSSLEPLVAAINDWDFPGQLQPLFYNGETFYIKEGSTTKTLFIGDSHVQQYAPRIAHMLKEYPGYNTAIFATYGSCLPFPNRDEKKSKCKSLRNVAFEYINRHDVETVVIGAAWNGYTLSDNDFSNLELFLQKVDKNKRIFLLLDNPSGKNFAPESFFEGSRLTQFRGTSAIKHKEPYALEQRQLGERLKSIANRTGAIIIDPSLYLCSKQRCMVTTENGDVIYKDEGHLRPFFIKQQAKYIDITIQ